MPHRRSSQIFALLLALAAASCLATSWDEERLQWLVVTPPGQRDVQLNCTLQNIYPFYLLNDSQLIGASGYKVKRVWWILPDGRLADKNYSDNHRHVEDGGVRLRVSEAVESTYGLYHCAAEAITFAANDSLTDWNSTTVYYYKRGLNLYGADLYGGNAWEKYKRNTLIGSLTAGIFLLIIAGYTLLDRFGVLAKCGASSNAVQAAPGAVEVGDGAPVVTSDAAKAAEAEMSSAATLRSRRSENPVIETAAL